MPLHAWKNGKVQCLTRVSSSIFTTSLEQVKREMSELKMIIWVHPNVNTYQINLFFVWLTSQNYNWHTTSNRAGKILFQNFLIPMHSITVLGLLKRLYEICALMLWMCLIDILKTSYGQLYTKVVELLRRGTSTFGTHLTLWADFLNKKSSRTIFHFLQTENFSGRPFSIFSKLTLQKWDAVFQWLPITWKVSGKYITWFLWASICPFRIWIV